MNSDFFWIWLGVACIIALAVDIYKDQRLPKHYKRKGNRK